MGMFSSNKTKAGKAFAQPSAEQQLNGRAVPATTQKLHQARDPSPPDPHCFIQSICSLNTLWVRATVAPVQPACHFRNTTGCTQGAVVQDAVSRFSLNILVELVIF